MRKQVLVEEARRVASRNNYFSVWVSVRVGLYRVRNNIMKPPGCVGRWFFTVVRVFSSREYGSSERVKFDRTGWGVLTELRTVATSLCHLPFCRSACRTLIFLLKCYRKLLFYSGTFSFLRREACGSFLWSLELETVTLRAKQTCTHPTFNRFSGGTHLSILEIMVTHATSNHFFDHFPASLAFETIFFLFYGFELGFPMFFRRWNQLFDHQGELFT